MPSASSSHRGAPYIPIIRCPECGRIVKRGTSKHPGWVHYKCEKHARGCVFWHWEREYVYYLVEHNFLVGTAGVDDVGWAEDRREVLELRREEQVATSPAQEDLVMQMIKEAIFLLRVLVVLVVVCCVVLILKK